MYKFQWRKIVVKDTKRGSEIKSFEMKYYNIIIIHPGIIIIINA